MKRVLIITYYWPPSGGAGVQRWLKFTKYLPGLGWKPIVYTPENPEAPVEDPTLLKDIAPEAEVVKRPIWEPYSWYKRFLGISSSEKINAGFISETEKPARKERVSVWIRGNMFIPDARKFWVRPSIRFLKGYLAENPVDLLITTGPPHSMHLIGLALSRQSEIPWLADFRDPWTQIDFYDQLRLSARADRKHQRLERQVLLGADRVITVGNVLAGNLEHISGRKVKVITNGYDAADFDSKEAPPDQKFSIIHVGAMNRDRNHEAFWNAIAALVRERDDFAGAAEVRLIGKTDISVLSTIQKLGLGDQVVRTEYIEHEQIAGILQSAHLLYLPINRTPKPDFIVTGKIFEYLASGTPILGTGPVDGDSSAILRESGRGIMKDFEDTAGIREELQSHFQSYLDPSLKEKAREKEKGKEKGKEKESGQGFSPHIYSREHLTTRLAEIMDEMVEQHKNPADS